MTDSSWRENETQRTVNQEVEEEYYDEPYSSLKRNRFPDFKIKSSVKSLSPMILAVLGLFALIVVLITIFAGSGDSEESRYYSELETHIGHLEKKIAELETLSARLASLETGTQRIDELTSRVSGFETSVTTRLDNLNRKMDLVERRLSKYSQKSTVTQPEKKQVSKRPAKAAATYHVVRKGDTLYRISKMYGLSVNQLRKANKLSASSKIYPGQKLKVTL